jgi:hypothetical protein
MVVIFFFRPKIIINQIWLIATSNLNSLDQMLHYN